jgi:DNA-directed RNA polymerase
VTLTDLERGQAPTKPFIQMDDKRTVVWIEGLYWASRQAIVKALDTPAKVDAVVAHLQSGEWDRKAKKAASWLSSIVKRWQLTLNQRVTGSNPVTPTN